MNAHVDRMVVIGDAALNHETPNRLPMKSFDSRTYSINDFVEWEQTQQLILSPRFQRRAVWSPKAKSYLIDTILRGKPFSKIFIRQIMNTTTRRTIKEIVDGQQRIRTILSFVNDGFSVSRSHNKEFAGLRFSQMPEAVQAQILSYEIGVDLLINLPDSEILDIFGRLNSYAIVLNEQEKLNAEYFGEFKKLADDVARNNYDYWLKQRVFTDKQMLRMLEVNLTADLFIAMLTGIKSKKQVGAHYKLFENNFNYDSDDLAFQFDITIDLIRRIFPEGLAGTELNRPFMFYTLFTSIFHCTFGIPGVNKGKENFSNPHVIANARAKLDRISEILAHEENIELTRAEREFLTDSTRATTDGAVRVRRTNFMIDLMLAS